MINLTITEEEVKDLVTQAVAKSEGYIKNQQWNEAEALLKQTLKVDSQCETALRTLAQLFINHQNQDAAIPVYERLLELFPKDFEALNNIALCYSSTKQHNKALDKLVQCMTIYPNIPSVYWNLAIFYKNQGHNEASFRIYEQGIKKHPHEPNIRFNYGVGLAEQFRFEEAISQYKKAIEIQPDFASAHFNLSLLYLLLGRWEEGWETYESRFQHATVFQKFKDRFHETPEWKGETVNDKTILVYNEQGAGDAIQFARYLPKLKDKGFKVILESPNDLIDLISQTPGADQVILQRSKNTPKYDYHVSIGSLPKVLKEKEPTWNGPYIKPTGSIDPKSFANYKRYKRVGVCWAGNPVHRNDHVRSCHLKYFQPLLNKDTKLFSLQKETSPRFWGGQGVVDLTEGCKDMGIVDMSDMLINFNYTAAIMQWMNYIITVDTAVAHIAGAMNISCYLLLPHLPDWRWNLNSDTTTWYPSLKLKRQKTPGDYESLIKEIAEEIK